MSFIDCVLQNAALTPKEAKALADEYGSLVKTYSKTMGSYRAADEAARKIVGVKEANLVKRKENTIRDFLAWQQIQARVTKDAALIQSQKDAAPTAKWLFGNPTASAARAKLERVHTVHEGTKAMVHRAIAETIEKYRPKNAGLSQDVEGFKSVVRSLLGKASGDVAIDAEAKAIREVFDKMHLMFKGAGGIIGKIDNYFPQSHNPITIQKLGVKAWKEKILPLLDREKMIDISTGLPFTDKSLDEALTTTYNSIINDGLDELMSRLDEGKVYTRGGAIAEKHSSSRFLYFKDAESYLEYNRELGYGDDGLFDAMMGHIEAMTRDISIMRELGPKPAAMVERLKTLIKANGGSTQSQLTLQGMYDTIAGRNHFSGKQSIIVDALDGTKNLLRASLLGGAPISAIPDSFNLAMTSKINGLEVSESMRNYFSLINPLDGADRRIARRLTFSANAANGKSLASARMNEDVSRHGKTAWLAAFTNNASGLGAMTDAVKQAAPLSAMGFFAEAKVGGLKWADLPQNMRDAFDRWDMTEADFNNIRRSELFIDEDTGADFITPESIAKSGYLETARKYNNWLTDMSLTASNEPRLLTKAITTGAVFGPAQKGTLLRESVGTLMMFKSFIITSMINHTLPYTRYALSTGKVQRLATHIVGATLLGAAALQLGELSKGKTTRDMDSPLFWMAAATKGGGFGLLGDIMLQDTSRFDYNIANAIGGPMVGLTNDVVRLTLGNLYKAMDENQEEKFWKDAVEFNKQYSPIPGAKLWYSRLLFDRAINDQLDRMADPEFDSRIMRVENKMQKETGQEYWWQPE